VLAIFFIASYLLAVSYFGPFRAPVKKNPAADKIAPLLITLPAWFTNADLHPDPFHETIAAGSLL
jgi:hypothetical protein